MVCKITNELLQSDYEIDGLKKLNAMKDILNRTCELKPDMMIFSSQLAIHITKRKHYRLDCMRGLTKRVFKRVSIY